MQVPVDPAGPAQVWASESHRHAGRAQVGALLEAVMRLVEPRAAALFALGNEGLRLVLGQGLAQRGLEAAAAEWQEHETRLSTGVPFNGDRTMVVPCVHGGGKLCGLLYLEDVSIEGRLPRSQWQVLGALFARALAPPPVASSAVRADEAEGKVAAENLLGLMEACEWNISHVARVLGVTRMTLYNRLRRLGLARKRIRKSERRTAPTGSSPRP